MPDISDPTAVWFWRHYFAPDPDDDAATVASKERWARHYAEQLRLSQPKALELSDLNPLLAEALSKRQADADGAAELLLVWSKNNPRVEALLAVFLSAALKQHLAAMVSEGAVCAQCGAAVERVRGKRERRFCDRCRQHHRSK